MSKPRYAWWGYMINIIRRYPERRQALAELRRMKVTVNYEASGHGGGGERTVEQIALRELDPQEMKEYEAVTAAIHDTEQMETGQARLKIIGLLYWYGWRKNLTGAAREVGYSRSRAEDFHGEFVRLVAYHMGYISRDKVSRTGKITLRGQQPDVK